MAVLLEDSSQPRKILATKIVSRQLRNLIPCTFQGSMKKLTWFDEESTTWITHPDRQPSVKKLMEEEMSSSRDSESELKFSDRKQRFLDVECDTGMTKIHKRTCSQELGSIQTTHSPNSKRDSRRGTSWSEEKLNEATKSICQKLKSGVLLSGEEESPHFEENPETFETIIPNNESCKNQLQDSNSVLVKYIQTILDSPKADIDGPNNNTLDPSSEHKIGRTSFFRRKMKLRQRNPEPDSSKTIVILKPGGSSSSPPKPPETFLPLHSGHGTRPSSQFYFSKMKRVFRIAMGKGSEPFESQTGAPPEKEKAGFGSGMGSTAEAEVRINMAAKKHLSQMLKKVNQNGGIFRNSDLKSLAEVLSFPDQLSIPARDLKNHHSLNPQPDSLKNDQVWWFHPRRGSSSDRDPSSSDSPVASSCLTDEDGGVKSDSSSSSSIPGNNSNADMVIKSSASEEHEEDIVMDISTLTFRNGESGYGSNQAEVAKVIQEKDGYMSSPETEKLIPFINEEMLPSSPPPPSHPCGRSDPSDSKEDDVVEKPEHPSPVSVLDAISSEDDTTPSKEWRLQGVLEEGAARKEDAGSGLKERVFGCLDQILKARRLNWEIRSFGIRDGPMGCRRNNLCSTSVDPELLSHCVEEVLGGVLGRVLDPAPWAECGSRVRPEMLAEDVWDGMRWILLPVEETPNLEQTVRRDFHGSGWWADHWPPGMESVAAEVGLAIEGDLVEDTVCECIDVLV